MTRKEEIKQAADNYRRMFPLNYINKFTFIDGAEWADFHKQSSFTASDQGIIDEIIISLNYLQDEKAISFDKEIHWLNSLKERL